MRTLSLAPLLTWTALAAFAQTRPDIRTLSGSLESLSEKVSPAVVQIFSTGYLPLDETDRGASLLTRQRSTGSGVVVSADGIIVTNAHVVSAARRIQVRLPATRTELAGRTSILKPEGRTLDAKVLGIDHETDVAVIQVAASTMRHLSFGNSDELRQGQLVLAFGNPLGLEGSVSMGIVSSSARQIRPDDPVIYVQTDAAINPGNSGGPLVDSDGSIVGLNTFILSQSGGNEGIGFAIPSNIVKSVVSQIRETGRVHRGQIGVKAQNITTELAAGLGLSQDWGVIAADVYPDGPAGKAGMEVGDIIQSLDGKIMENSRQLEINVYRRTLKEKVKVAVLRGTEKLSMEIPVIERIDDPQRFADMANPEDNLIPRLGILGIGIDKTLAAMLPTIRKQFGVVVAARSANAPYSGTGLESGDVIYSVNNVPVTSVAALKVRLEEIKPGGAAVLQVERNGKLQFLSVELE